MSTADVESSPGLPDYLLSPNAVLSDTAQWRYGKAPDYSSTRRIYGETKLSSHAAGSLPQLVENLVKNWEIEASHKTSLSDWRTVDRENYSFSVNGGEHQTGEHMLEVGTYNAIISSPNEFYDGKTMGFDGSHKVFKGMMKSFAWEVVEVYSELPRVAFKWRHWGTMSGDYVGVNGKSRMVTVKAHGGPIDIQGISIATVDDQARIQKIETWFDPLEMFRQIAPNGIVAKEKIITQLDGSEAPVSKNESGQGVQGPMSRGEAANDKQHQVTTTAIEMPCLAVEAYETNNPKSVEECIGTTEKVNSAVETDTLAAADLAQQSRTDELNQPDQKSSTEPSSSSLQSEQKNVIATATTTTTELAKIPTSDEPNCQRAAYEENLAATKSVPEPNQQPPMPTIHSNKTEFLVQPPSESVVNTITPSNKANDKNTPQSKLIPSYLDDNKDPRRQQQQQPQEEVDRSSGKTTCATTISIPIPSERGEGAKRKQQPSSSDVIEIPPVALEERLSKLEARLARLEFMERFFVVGSSDESGNSTGTGTGAGAAGILKGNAGVATSTLGEVVKKEEGEDNRKTEEDRFQVQVQKTDAHEHDVEEENEKSMITTASKVLGNEFSPFAEAVAGAGCPFLNRG